MNTKIFVILLSVSHREEQMAHRYSRNNAILGILRAACVAAALGWLVVPAGAAAADEEVELLAMVDALSEMSISIDDPGDPRRKQDRALKEDLLALVDAFTAVEDRIVALSEADPERWAVIGPLRLAQARAAMGEHIRSSDAPSYLDDDQRMVYQQALRAKGDKQLSTALEAYELALHRAAERGLEGELVDEAREGLAAVQAMLED